MDVRRRAHAVEAMEVLVSAIRRVSSNRHSCSGFSDRQDGLYGVASHSLSRTIGCKGEAHCTFVASLSLQDPTLVFSSPLLPSSRTAKFGAVSLFFLMLSFPSAMCLRQDVVAAAAAATAAGAGLGSL